MKAIKQFPLSWNTCRFRNPSQETKYEAHIAMRHRIERTLEVAVQLLDGDGADALGNLEGVVEFVVNDDGGEHTMFVSRAGSTELVDVVDDALTFASERKAVLPVHGVVAELPARIEEMRKIVAAYDTIEARGRANRASATTATEASVSVA